MPTSSTYSVAWGITVHRFRESYLPFVGDKIKNAFEELKVGPRPQIVCSHRRDDQDHQTIAQVTWNTFRDQLILEYEIPKYEGDLGRPKLYAPLESDIANRKVELLMEHFATQRDKIWFRPETFQGLTSVRAVEYNAVSGWAEAFHVRKIVV